MITTNNVRQLKKQLEDTLIICNQMIQSREIDRLFTSEKDYRDSYIACKIVPDDFFKFRLFDVLIELKFNSRTKNYYIYIECEKLPFSLLELNAQFDDVFIKLDRKSQFNYSFDMDKFIPFDIAQNVYKKFCRFILNYLIKE